MSLRMHHHLTCSVLHWNRGLSERQEASGHPWEPPPRPPPTAPCSGSWTPETPRNLRRPQLEKAKARGKASPEREPTRQRCAQHPPEQRSPEASRGHGAQAVAMRVWGCHKPIKLESGKQWNISSEARPIPAHPLPKAWKGHPREAGGACSVSLCELRLL